MIFEFNPGRPKWVQIAAWLREKIESGEYPPGHRISEVELVAYFDTARETVRKATAKLRDEGLIYTEHGMGSFVSSPPDDAS